MTESQDHIMWTPSDDRIRQTNITAMIEQVEEDWNVAIQDHKGLYDYSVTEKEKFWQSMVDFAGLTAETWGSTVLENPDHMPGAVWFPDAKLNYAENLLRSREDTDAIVFWGEDQVRNRFTHKELYNAVSVLAQAMRAT